MEVCFFNAVHSRENINHWLFTFVNIATSEIIVFRSHCGLGISGIDFSVKQGGGGTS